MEIAILFSGEGTNAKSIIERSYQSDSRYHVKLTVTDNSFAPGIQKVHELNKSCIILPKKGWDYHLYEILHHDNIDLIVLAGFMKILPSLLCKRWKQRCINIHPSLLPNYKGLHTHRRVLLSTDTEHGCSIHYVIPELDSGPIIAQSKVPVLYNDTEEVLAKRVLEQEIMLYPEVIQNIALRRITTDGQQIWFDRNILRHPLTLNDLRN